MLNKKIEKDLNARGGNPVHYEWTVAQWPENLAEASELWGEEVVFQLAMGAAEIKCRSEYVSSITGKEPITEEEANDRFWDWVPMFTKATTVEKKTAKLLKMARDLGLSAEDLAEMMED